MIAGTSAAGEQLYQRPLDRLEATPIPGTEGGSAPFFSTDGRWIGFVAEGRLRKIPAAGGMALDIATVPMYLSGASWGRDGRIVFGSGVHEPVYTVTERGGDAEPMTQFVPGEVGHRHPEILPDDRTLLFASGEWIHALDMRSGRRAALAQGSSPRYAASGHLIMGRGSVLLAAPFDRKRLELTGPAAPVVEGVAHEGTGVLHYAISRAGSLAYLPGATSHSLVIVGADGTERPVTQERLAFENPQFSPDGRRLAVATGRRPGEQTDVWIHDLNNGSASRLTFDGGRAPVWRPDGSAITYSKLGKQQGIYTRAADGRGDAERLIEIKEFHWLIGWTPDGSMLAYGTMDGASEEGTQSSIMSYTAGERRRVVGPGSVWGGRLSPDGRWLVYYTLESGRFDVYVTPFPAGRARWLISDVGGRDPAWGPDGTEIFYRNGDRLLAARVDTTAGIRVLGRRTVVTPFSPPLYDDYDIHPDRRTLVLVRPRDEPDQNVVVVLDWITEVRRATAP